MESAVNNRPDLATTLSRLIGASILVNYTGEEEAQRLYAKLRSDHERLDRMISLCGTPKTPQQLYVVTTAYSWPGGNDELAAKYVRQYLETPEWDCLSYGAMIQDGVTISRWAKSRVEIYVIPAQIQENLGKYETVLTNFAEAHHLEPYDAMHAVKVADMIEHARSRKEVLQFLKQQTLTSHYRPPYYKDEHGNRDSSQTFCQTIDSRILEPESRKD